MIPYGRQEISDEDVAAVERALRSPYLTQGPRVQEFEADLASYSGASYAVAVNSATSALHISCLALGVGQGDTVWTSAISFVASANAALYCGAEVDFVDIDPITFNMSSEALAQKLRHASGSGAALPKVVIPVAMAGQSADMAQIRELSLEFGFKILEDASHALGATYMGSKVGSCAFSDITVFSFHPVKMITTGEGGACVTNSPDLVSKLQRLRSHGITRNPSEMESPSPGAWYYEQLELGYNYRITDIQCALGISQLKRLDEFVSLRNQVAELYQRLISHSWIRHPEVLADRASSFHLYVVNLLPNAPVSRNKLFETFRANGILVNLHYIPIYRHPYYSKMKKYEPSQFPLAENYFSNAISIPIFPSLSVKDVDDVVAVIDQQLGFQTIF